MSVAEQASERGVARTQRYGTIVVVGGGCYGSYYVRQLRRASHAGALVWRRVLVVDRNAQCAVATSGALTQQTTSSDGMELVVSDWRSFFRAYLGRASSDPTEAASDAIVPSPLMPHLMFDWIVERARERWPDRAVTAERLTHAPNTPWQWSTLCELRRVDLSHQLHRATDVSAHARRSHVESSDDRSRIRSG